MANRRFALIFSRTDVIPWKRRCSRPPASGRVAALAASRPSLLTLARHAGRGGADGAAQGAGRRRGHGQGRVRRGRRPQPRPQARDAGRSVEAKKRYSPYADRKYPTHVYFGDTHHHTANSGDAFMAGDRLTPEQSYRFARGEEVDLVDRRAGQAVAAAGLPRRLGSRRGPRRDVPGLRRQPGVRVGPDARPLGQGDEGRRRGGGRTMRTNSSRRRRRTRCRPPIKDPKVVGPIMKSVWQAVHGDRREVQRARAASPR